jgi:hypothetical protein
MAEIPHCGLNRPYETQIDIVMDFCCNAHAFLLLGLNRWFAAAVNQIWSDLSNRLASVLLLFLSLLTVDASPSP